MVSVKAGLERHEQHVGMDCQEHGALRTKDLTFSFWQLSQPGWADQGDWWELYLGTWGKGKGSVAG